MDESIKENKELTQENAVAETEPVAQSVAPEVMAPVTTNSKSRKKVIIIVLSAFVLLLILGCVAVFGFFYYIAQQQVKGLKKAENDRLTFYYPDNYNTENADSGEFVYSSPDKNKFGGNSSIRTMDDTSLEGYDKIKDKDSCKKFAEGTLTGDTNAPVQPADEVVYSDNLGLKVCSFKVSYDAKDFGKNGTVILNVKVIVKGSDKDAAVASYDDSTSKEETDKLVRSLSLFGFKK